MRQLVLQQHVESSRREPVLQPGLEILRQVTDVDAICERDDIDVMSAASQVLDQHSVVEIAARDELEIAVNDEPNLHDDEVYLA